MKDIEKLLAANPRARALIRELVTLRSMIGDPELAAAEPEIALAALHLEEALEILSNDLDSNQ